MFATNRPSGWIPASWIICFGKSYLSTLPPCLQVWKNGSSHSSHRTKDTQILLPHSRTTMCIQAWSSPFPAIPVFKNVLQEIKYFTDWDTKEPYQGRTHVLHRTISQETPSPKPQIKAVAQKISSRPKRRPYCWSSSKVWSNLQLPLPKIHTSIMTSAFPTLIASHSNAGQL